MESYGQFEEMVLWFRKSLERNGKLFQAPGHHWMVFKRPLGFNEAKFSEVLRIVQAIIVLDGIAGNIGHHRCPLLINGRRSPADGYGFLDLGKLHNYVQRRRFVDINNHAGIFDGFKTVHLEYHLVFPGGKYRKTEISLLV